MEKSHFLQRILVGTMAFLMAFVPVANTYAAMSEQTLDRFAQNNILFYDPTSGGSCYAGGASLSGDTIMAKVVNYLNGNNPTGFILSPIGIAGVLAGVQGESGFNPFRFQSDSPSGPAYGFAQYDPMSKITDKLKTDPRTSGFFNEYFDIKYTKTDPNTGLPLESVPTEVIDAWLAVQLDFTFGPGGEFDSTKVSGYRNLGGTMGLDYIGDNLTLHEAMDAAASPEDATRIWVWIYERPAKKEEASNHRSTTATGWLNYVNTMVSSIPSGTVSSGTENNGSNVTIIGDSIIAASQGVIADKLPQAKINAQNGRSFADGITTLQSMADGGELGNVVIIALGTDGGNVTSDQAQQIVDIAGSSRKIAFITNYSKDDDYDSNNNVFAKIKNDNSNVRVLDWKASASSQPSYLAEDGKTPSQSGASLIASMISSIASSPSSPASGICDSMGALEGGLNESQAQALLDYYKSPAVVASDWGLPSGKKNCVSLSYFFVQKFTTIGRTSYTIFHPNGNGVDAAPNLAKNRGLPSGNEPRPFSIFSVSKGSLMCGNYLCGHTGVVLGVDGDKVLTIEAAYQEHDGKIGHRNLSYFVNDKGAPFTYLENIMNMEELYSIIGN